MSTVSTLCRIPLRRRLASLLVCASLAASQHRCDAFSALSSASKQSSRDAFPTPLSSPPPKPKANPDEKICLASKFADHEEAVLSRPNIVAIKTHDDYVEFLEGGDRLCVIKFYANWCKSCQRFGAKFRHLAFEDGDRIDAEGSMYHSGRVRFAEVEYSASAKLCKSLKVRRLPTVHMYYRGRGKVADMCCKPSQFHLVVDEMHRLMTDPGAKLKGEIKVNMGREAGDGSSGNATSTASFDEAMAKGSSLADKIMTSLKKEGKDGTRENSWFPFTF